MARSKLRCLITGWNRGGLGYVHELLNKAGQDAGLTFGSGTTRDSFLRNLPEACRYEISPYVVPFLDAPELEHVRVVFLLRDPLRVLNSLYYHGSFHAERLSPARDAAETYLHGFRRMRGRPAQAICSYLNNWLKLARSLRPDMEVTKVESGPRFLLEFLAGKSLHEVPYLPPTVNSSGCRQLILPSTLPPHSQAGMRILLSRLGYIERFWAPRGGHAHYVNPDWHC